MARKKDAAPATQAPEVPASMPESQEVPETTALQEPEVQEVPADYKPEIPDPEPEPFTPYTAKVSAALLVIRRVPAPEGKPIGTLHRGMKVEVVESRDGYAKLKNGTWVSEAHLERQQ